MELKGADKAIELFKKLPLNTRVAASRAINDSLKDAQVETGKEILPDAFTLRGRGKQWWEPGQKFGFNVRPYSNPSTLEGRMGSQASWLKEQEHGGTRERANKMAIPAGDYKGKTEIMRKAIKPRTVTKKSDVFFATLKSGLSGIFKRIAWGEPLKLLFSMKPNASYRAVLNFGERAGEHANKRFNPNFARRFIQIMK